MNAQELRPMGIGDILDTTFRLYRQKFVTFLLIALVVYVPYALLAAVFQSTGAAVSPAAQPLPGADAAPVPFNTAAFALGLMGTLVFAFLLLPLCSAAMIHNISASYLGEELSAGGSYSRAAPRLLPLLGTQILSGLIILVGYLLLIVPGIIFSLWFAVIAPVVILEHLSGQGALGRSRELMRGNLGKAFVLGFVVAILVGIISAALSAILGLIPWPHVALEACVQTILPALWLPIQTAPFILLYYDLRIRKEAFDLQQLSDTLGQPAAT